MRLNSQSESGKWWSSLQGRGEVDGEIRHLGESPSSAGLRPHGPWRTIEIRGPDLTWNLSFIFIYDFWKHKSRKNWKRNIFQIELTAKEFFGTEIDENEIQNCKSLEQTLKTVFSCFFCRGQSGQAIKLFQAPRKSRFTFIIIIFTCSGKHDIIK